MKSWFRRVLIAVGAYLFVLIPIYSLAAAIEGATRGLWQFTAPSLIDQSSGFLVQTVSFMIPAGLFAVPILVWVVSRHITRKGATGFLIATITVAVVLVGATSPFFFMELLVFPVALVAASAAYAVVLMRTLHDQAPPAPAP